MNPYFTEKSYLCAKKYSMIRFEYCDFNNTAHCAAMVSLLNHYMEDPMGDHPPHDEVKQLQLIEGLKNHPTAEVLLMFVDDEPAGLATTFINYSTFAIRPYLYIHDVVVLDRFRGRGLGKALIAELIRISETRNYSKLTLEVREDNPGAQQVYHSLGFEECEPRMFFWTKKLK